MLAAGVGRGIHVCDKADDRCSLGSCRQCGHNIAVVVKRHLLQTDGFQFVRQITRKLHLSRSRGRHVRVLVARGAERHVFQKSVDGIHDELFVSKRGEQRAQCAGILRCGVSVLCGRSGSALRLRLHVLHGLAFFDHVNQAVGHTIDIVLGNET